MTMPTRSSRQSLIDATRLALDDAESARVAGEHRIGVEAATRAQALAAQAGNVRMQASALCLLALHELRIGECERAIGHALQALPMLKREKDAADRTRLLCTLVMAYNDIGLHGEALPHATRALDSARASGDKSLLSWALNRAGITYEGLSDPDEAERFLMQALQIAREIDGAEETFSALNNLCSNINAACEALPPDAARSKLMRGLAHGSEALKLAQASANAHRQAISHSNLAGTHTLLRNDDDALQHLEAAEALSQQHGFRGLTVSALGDRAKLLRLQGDTGRAVALYEAALAEAIAMGDLTTQRNFHLGLYESHKAAGDFAGALRHHEAVLPLERDQLQQRADVQARLLLHRLELEQARADAERARLDAEVQRLRAAQLENENRALELQARELGRHALEDQLTGLANRRRVDHELPAQLLQARERHAALSIAAVDLDHFKQVNDRYGHAVGDDVLRVVARLLTEKTRSTDLVARMGGEEFLVVFVGTPLGVANDICERLRCSVEAHDWGAMAAGLHLTISIGLCEAPGSSDMRTVLERADASLYTAKRAGRNRVEVAAA
jgi:diguanylate cyclase